MFVKICGIQDVETARAALCAGATHIGLVFAARSKRKVTLEQAQPIAAAVKAAGGLLVGVFEGSEREEIESIANALSLDFVQLHGQFFALDRPCLFALAYGEAAPAEYRPGKDLLLFDNKAGGSGCEPDRSGFQTGAFLSGGLTPENVRKLVDRFAPLGVDASSGLETDGRKDLAKIRAFVASARPGYFGAFGGLFVPELLIAPLKELQDFQITPEFNSELASILKHYAGRPTAVTEVPRFAAAIGSSARIFLKREDLLHTGAHKINNALGQCLLAKKMGKTRIVAETGAGQHGLATATACALFGLECVVYMGQVDIERQATNVAKMKLLGAQVVPVFAGSQTLKDAVNEALRDWAESYESTHYCLGSALGPHPFPSLVERFQSVIGIEAKKQMRELTGKDPDAAIACVGGGSNAIGLFSAYLSDPVELIGVEAGGKGPGRNAARFQEGSPGVLHGSYSYMLQDEQGQVKETTSISAGLDYPGVGPHHSQLFESGRVRYESAPDDEALRAFELLAKTEGIIPALESSHALAYAMRYAPSLPAGSIVLINLSGRGDKDLAQVFHGSH